MNVPPMSTPMRTGRPAAALWSSRCSTPLLMPPAPIWIHSTCRSGPPRAGADIYKIHVATKRIVKLTNQRFSPNTGAANWSKDFRNGDEGKTHFDYGVFNMGPRGEYDLHDPARPVIRLPGRPYLAVRLVRA